MSSWLKWKITLDKNKLVLFGNIETINYIPWNSGLSFFGNGSKKKKKKEKKKGKLN
jgi:hypothetical protein